MCQLSQHFCFQVHYSSYKRAPPFSFASYTSVLGKPSIKYYTIMQTPCRFSPINDRNHEHYLKKKYYTEKKN